MKKTDVKVKLIHRKEHKAINLPEYKTSGSAGLDLRSYSKSSLYVSPGDRIKVPTGICIELTDPYLAGFVFPRSGLGHNNGIILSNCVGVVDSDYRGELIVSINNTGNNEFCIEPGDRIAQLVIMPIAKVQLLITDDIGDTDRGNAGFGSTGIQ